MPTIDSDAHVIETERTWEFFEPADLAYKPVSLVASDPQTPRVLREFWRVDKRIFPRRLFDPDRVKLDVEAQELENIGMRLRHMDDLGVDMHVLYPTMFLQPITTVASVEVAVYKSYNRWLGEIWEKGEKRLRWAVLVPTLDMNAALLELAWAKEHGAVAVFMRGFEGNRVLSDPYFHPLYAEASRLNMPICLHSGTGSLAIQDLCANDMAIMQRTKLNVVGAVHELIMSHVPEKFPKLRWGVIECSASWIPYLCHDLGARLSRMFDTHIDEKDVLRSNRIFVACQTDDDLPYVLQYAGEDNLVIGSDYGHADTSSELEALRHLKQAGTIPSHVVDKILDANARSLYGL